MPEKLKKEDSLSETYHISKEDDTLVKPTKSHRNLFISGLGSLLVFHSPSRTRQKYQTADNAMHALTKDMWRVGRDMQRTTLRRKWG